MTHHDGRPVIMLGGGGHAAVCLDVLRASGHAVMGYLATEEGALDAPHLGGDDEIEDLAVGEHGLFVAIGSNRLRRLLIRRLFDRGHDIITVVSPAATLSPSARLGAGTIVMPGVVVNARTTIGSGVIVNTSVSVDHDGVLHDFCHLAPGCHLAGTVTVGEGAFLGVGCSVVPSVTIGAWATVGAGAAIVNDVDDEVTAVGVPARPLVR